MTGTDAESTFLCQPYEADSRSTECTFKGKVAIASLTGYGVIALYLPSEPQTASREC